MSVRTPQWVWSQEHNQYFYSALAPDGRWWKIFQDGSRQLADRPRTIPPDQYINTLSDSIQNLNVNEQGQTGQHQNVQHGYNPQTGVVSRVAITASGHKTLLGSPGRAERIDPLFRLRSDPRGFFTIGKVFYTLWTEPAGSNGSAAGSFISQVRFGESVFTQIRRFVVVAENHSHCTAIPITTYGGRGLAKQRINHHEHGIIYTGNAVPQMGPDDAGMLPVALRVDPSERGERLDPLSRINFGKIYTIEHNLKVKPFGVVRDKAELVQTFQRVHSRGLYTLREATAELNTPAAGLGRPSQPEPSSSRQQPDSGVPSTRPVSGSRSQRPSSSNYVYQPVSQSGRRQSGGNNTVQQPVMSTAVRAQQLQGMLRTLAGQFRDGQITRDEYESRSIMINEQIRALRESAYQSRAQAGEAENDDDEDDDDEKDADDQESKGRTAVPNPRGAQYQR